MKKSITVFLPNGDTVIAIEGTNCIEIDIQWQPIVILSITYKNNNVVKYFNTQFKMNYI